MLSALMESSPHNLTAKGSRCCINSTPYVFTMDVSNSSALFCRQKKGGGGGELYLMSSLREFIASFILLFSSSLIFMLSMRQL